LGLLTITLGLVSFFLCPDTLAAKLALRFGGEYAPQFKYARGDSVSWKGKLYQAVKPIQRGVVPDENPQAWRVVLVGFQAAPGENDCSQLYAGGNLAGCRLEESGGPNPLKDKDLSGANLTRANIIGDLGNISLIGAKLIGANLGEVAQGGIAHPVSLASGVSLAYADLSGLYTNGTAALQAAGVDFSWVTAVSASLQSANLEGANFTNANLEGTSFGGTNLKSAILSNARVGGVDFYYAILADSQLNGVDLSGIANNALDNVDLSRASLNGANLRNLILTHVNLTGTYLGFANLSGVRADHVTIGTDPDNGDTNFESATCPDNTFVDMTTVTTCVGHGF